VAEDDRERADVALVRRGLFATRAKAQAAIAAGRVTVDGALVARPGQLVARHAAFSAEPAHPWVSRGGLKLATALDAFGVDPTGWTCLDIGASTGGFTQVLRARGAAKVYAVDVGRDQLAATVRDDLGVVDLSGVDARTLTRDHAPEPIRLVVADVSFIGLSKALPAALSLAADTADVIALIKPQFEAGPGDPLAPSRNKRGQLPDDAARAVADRTARALDGTAGFGLVGLIESPVRGGAGAWEALARFTRGA
jgi:23S rRNA (cytidine1920-2'-O)/16S rRNA (cytidine1409-2'-O)-methyltransferase